MIKNYVYKHSRTATSCEICLSSFKWNNKNERTVEKVYKIEFKSIPLVVYAALLMNNGLENLEQVKRYIDCHGYYDVCEDCWKEHFSGL